MKMLNALLASALALALPAVASAQEDWPSRSITLIVPYAPGGYTDTVGRITARYLEEHLDQTVVVENRGGAGGILGTALTAGAEPDGYTFCVCSIGAVSVAPIAQKNVSYDPLKDLEPISWVSTNPQVVIVNPDVPVENLQGLISYAKEHPGELNYGSSGVGGLMHFSVALFQNMTGTELTHIPYKGGAPATAAVVAGEADLTFTNASDAIPQIASGAVRGIAVTSPERAAFAPDLPAIAEEVPGFSAISWNAVMGPIGIPDEIVEKMASVLADMAKDPKVQKSMADIGASTVAISPQEFRANLEAELEQWTALLEQINAE